MNIKDYNKAMMRMNADPELKEEIMERYEKKYERRSISKKKLIPIAVAVAVCCASIPVVFASEFMGIFKKSRNFEMAITDIEQPESVTAGSEQLNAENLNTYNAVPKMWEKEDLLNAFAKGEIISEADKIVPDEQYPDLSGEDIIFENNARLAYYPGDIYYDTAAYADKTEYEYPGLGALECYLSFGDIEPDFKLKSDELKGFEKEKAVSQADDIMSKLGISVSPEKTVYSLDVDILKRIDDYNRTSHIYKNGVIFNNKWTEEQEAYMIIYTVEYDGIPASDESMQFGKNYESSHWTTFGSKVYAVVSKNGIEKFEAHMIYEPTEIKNNISICTAEQAADVIGDKFDKEIARDPTTIEKCRLVYHAAKNGSGYELRPYWEFRSVVHNYYYTMYPEGEEFEYATLYFVDAETLELLTSENISAVFD